MPDSLGGLTLKAGTTDRLLIGGAANDAAGALYEVGVVRDGSGHIVGFSGSATRFADAANNDGGVTYGPGGVLFLARWPLNELGQTKPGSTITDKIISLTPLGIESSLASLQFVPQGQPGAGSLKLASYRGGALVRRRRGRRRIRHLRPGQRARDRGLEDRRRTRGLRLRADRLAPVQRPEPAGLRVRRRRGQPPTASTPTATRSSRRGARVITGLDGAEGALLDPVTGDFLFSTFGGGSRVVAVRGFRAPPPPLPPPEAGKTVNVFVVSGKVRIKLRGSRRFVELEAGQQIPVGSTVDARRAA